LLAHKGTAGYESISASVPRNESEHFLSYGSGSARRRPAHMGCLDVITVIRGRLMSCVFATGRDEFRYKYALAKVSDKFGHGNCVILRESGMMPIRSDHV
jgi:hypothetical protein